MAFDANAEPTGAELQAFRVRIHINGLPCTQQQLADSINVNVGRIRAYEREKRGMLMPAQLWTLTRITWDALAMAEWQKTRPRHDD